MIRYAFLLIIYSLTIGHASLWGFDVSNVQIKPLKDTAFKRISEYFTQKESPGPRTILRTNDKHTEGLYFIIELGPIFVAPDGVDTVTVNIFSAKKNRVISYDFKLPQPYKNQLYLGLTGTDNRAREDINSWNLIFKDDKGDVIAEKSSFTWQYEANT